MAEKPKKGAAKKRAARPKKVADAETPGAMAMGARRSEAKKPAAPPKKGAAADGPSAKESAATKKTPARKKTPTGKKTPAGTKTPASEALWVPNKDAADEVPAAKRASRPSKAKASTKSTLPPRAVGLPAISHPEKVLFPDEGITKGELAAYYEAIAPVMLPHIRGRPVTMERFHRGIAEDGFFQKDVSKGFPEWLERVQVPKSNGVVNHPLVMDTRSLVWMANQNSITPHVWVSRVPDLLHPDICVFDLDPSVDDLPMLRDAALALRDLLGGLGLASWVKTTGSKGYHIAVPLDRSADTGTVARFADMVGARLVERHPDTLTREFHKVDRGRRILVDTGRNGYSATYAATYAVRARPGAPVSAPCTWQEVERGAVNPRTLTLRGMSDRVASVGDLWAEMLEKGTALDGALATLRG